MILRRLGRVLAAAALVASGATVATIASTAPASAADTPITYDCSAPPANPTIGNGDTLTVTILNSNCGFVIFDNPGQGTFGTATLNGFSMVPGNPLAINNGDVLVFTAPATGSGGNSFSFWTSLSSPPPVSSLQVMWPVASGSMVDNADGTMTVTYEGIVFLQLFAQGATCSDPYVPGPSLYTMSNSPGSPVPFPASPAVVTEGTDAMAGSPNATPIAAGTYVACLYLVGGGSLSLEQELTVTLGEVAPTTTTSGTDPVTPSFTG